MKMEVYFFPIYNKSTVINFELTYLYDTSTLTPIQIMFDYFYIQPEYSRAKSDNSDRAGCVSWNSII